MDHHAGLGDLLEPGLALEDDEGAVALGRETARPRATSVGDVLGRARSAGESSQPNEPTRPMRSSARRSSGWKTTTSANRPTTAPVWRIWVSSRRSSDRAAT